VVNVGRVIGTECDHGLAPSMCDFGILLRGSSAKIYGALPLILR